MLPEAIPREGSRGCTTSAPPSARLKPRRFHLGPTCGSYGCSQVNPKSSSVYGNKCHFQIRFYADTLPGLIFFGFLDFAGEVFSRGERLSD